MPASTPQGSPLSPILHIYYNADLLSGETSPQISTTTRATMVKPSAQTLTNRSPLTSISIGHHTTTPWQREPCISIQKHPFLAPATEISTENTGGSSIIGGISPFQVRTVHLDTFLQYFPGPWVPAPGSYLYRSKNI